MNVRQPQRLLTGKAGQHHCSALDGINGQGGGGCTLVELTGSFIKHGATTQRTEWRGGSPMLCGREKPTQQAP